MSPAQAGTYREDLRRRLQGRLVVVGVGNELRGDDGWGPAAVRALAAQVGPEQQGQLFDCGDVPENYLGPVIAARPETIVILDAVDFGAPAGTVRLIEFDHAAGPAISTHNAPLGLVAQVLAADSGAPVWLLGVQPAGTQFGAPLSESVRRSGAEVVEALTELLAQGT